MKVREVLYLVAEPFLPPLHKQVRNILKTVAASSGHRPEFLDVGGRKSHYTIGVQASITITDIRRETDMQQRLHLGLNETIMRQVKQRRSNVKQIIFDDMTASNLPNESYDCVIAVEVLEHVERDQAFVGEVHRVLKSGKQFVLTTPNGESVVKVNPDHKRHYRRDELADLLSRSFSAVEVHYAVPSSAFYTAALHSWSYQKPFQTLAAMMGGFVSTAHSRTAAVRLQSQGTNQLVALATK
jgi:SAM-dependent methyltransferase